MADAARKSTGAKTLESDHAALTLFDAAFCISANDRVRLVREAIDCDAALKNWAMQWAAQRANDDDVAVAVASALFAFFHSLTSESRRKRGKAQGAAPPFTDGWRRRLASIASRLGESEAATAPFDDQLETAKIDALKEFAYGAGHEINNPLANISARAQTLLRDETHGERRRMLATINRQAMRAHEMISDLMLFARPPRLEIVEFDAATIVRRVVEELSAMAAAQATRLILREPQGALLAHFDRVQFGVAVKAVVRNAIEAVAAGGNVEVKSRIVADHGGREIGRDNGIAGTFHGQIPTPPKVENDSAALLEISVRDDGPGFSEREQAHLFDPFFSGREAGRGLGFGLCLAWRIATDHGGQIAALSEPGRGTTVVLTLPVEGPETQT